MQTERHARLEVEIFSLLSVPKKEMCNSAAEIDEFCSQTRMMVSAATSIMRRIRHEYEIALRAVNLQFWRT